MKKAPSGAFFLCIESASGGFLVAGRRGLFLRLQVLHQALEPDHQAGVALDLDVLVLDALHEGQLGILRGHGGEAVGAVLEAQRKGRVRVRAATGADLEILDDVVAGDLAVEGVELEHQVLAFELLLERRVFAAGLGHQATQHPQEKTEFHAQTSTFETIVCAL